MINELPTKQVNAQLSRELVMRIGIPHRGGQLTAHAMNSGMPAMVSASAFWEPTKGRFVIPELCNLHEVDFALDSAGFTAMQLWKKKGQQPGLAGVFPWSLAQYMELANSCGAQWWAQPDQCCEPEIASSNEEVDRRVRATATLLEASLQQLYAWQNELARTCSARAVANQLKPCVPVLQGWSIDHYLRSLDLMLQVWQRWTPWLAMPALIGIGSVCRRDLNHPSHGLYAILRGLDGALPEGSRLHLFGIKGASLNRVKELPWVASADSMAWDFSSRVDAFRRGESNTMQSRIEAMDQWMQTQALARLKPGGTEQLLLGV